MVIITAVIHVINFIIVISVVVINFYRCSNAMKKLFLLWNIAVYFFSSKNRCRCCLTSDCPRRVSNLGSLIEFLSSNHHQEVQIKTEEKNYSNSKYWYVSIFLRISNNYKSILVITIKYSINWLKKSNKKVEY